MQNSRVHKTVLLLLVSAMLAPAAIGNPDTGDDADAMVQTIREASLVAFVKRLYAEMKKDNENLRRKALTHALPTKDDILALLPDDDAERLWPYMRKRLDKVIDEAPLMKGWQRDKMHLDNIISTVTVVDIHESPKWQEDAPKFLELINEEIPAYWVVTHRDPDNPDRLAESGPYFYIDGRWRWIPNFQRVRPIVLKLRRKAAKKAAEQTDP